MCTLPRPLLPLAPTLTSSPWQGWTATQVRCTFFPPSHTRLDLPPPSPSFPLPAASPWQGWTASRVLCICIPPPTHCELPRPSPCFLLPAPRQQVLGRGGQGLGCCVFALKNLVAELLLVAARSVEGEVPGQHRKQHHTEGPHILHHEQAERHSFQHQANRPYKPVSWTADIGAAGINLSPQIPSIEVAQSTQVTWQTSVHILCCAPTLTYHWRTLIRLAATCF